MKRREIVTAIIGPVVGAIVGEYLRVSRIFGTQSSRVDTRESSEFESTQSTESLTSTVDQLESTQSTENPTSEVDDVQTSTTTEQSSEFLSIPFVEKFQNGLNGWEVNQRFRTGSERPPSNPRPGDGGYSRNYRGSVRLHVSGGPSTIGVARSVQRLPEGTTLSATYKVESQYAPGKVAIAIFAPDGDDKDEEIVASTDGDITPGTATVTGEVSKTYPNGSEIRVLADVWPGDYTAYVTEILAK